MTRMVIMPGLAVRGYVQTVADTLSAGRFDVSLLPPPAGRGCLSDLAAYGHEWAAGVRQDGRPVDVLVGLSVGTQAAAVAAAATDRVRRLVLVSPTVDPALRTMPRLVSAWVRAGRREHPRLMLEQAPEWFRAGPRRLVAGLRSALQVRLEDVLPTVSAQLTVVHAEHDEITSHRYAAQLAATHQGQLILVPGGSHSWPYREPDRFQDLIEAVLDG